MKIAFRYGKVVTDSDFVYLKGIKDLELWDCTKHLITGVGFEHIAGIEKLDMSGCENIPDAAFIHLKGIKDLKIGCCHHFAEES